MQFQYRTVSSCSIVYAVSCMQYRVCSIVYAVSYAVSYMQYWDNISIQYHTLPSVWTWINVELKWITYLTWGVIYLSEYAVNHRITLTAVPFQYVDYRYLISTWIIFQPLQYVDKLWLILLDYTSLKNILTELWTLQWLDLVKFSKHNR